jgi:hypothetical protein
LLKLRRQQLIDLAKAFDIDVPQDATAPELREHLRKHEEQGAFRQPPKRPEYYVKASRSPDDPPVDWESHRAQTVSKDDFRMLQKLAKDNGINSFGKGAEELWDELEKAGVV